jgi:deoxyribonuclease-4
MMKKDTLLLGSHVDMNKKNGFLVGAFKQAQNEKANTFMFFAGPPQSTMRTDINEVKIEEFAQLCQENNIDRDDLLVHAPYLINLANPVKPDTVNFSIEFLKKEITRVLAMGVSLIVLHPGASVGGDRNVALTTLAHSLDLVLDDFQGTKIRIALETMSGKGTEVCTNFDDFKTVFGLLKHKDKVGVCFDICHLSDSGYDVKNDFDGVLAEFDAKVGLNKLWATHLNDSKNERGAKKDRHENIGHGYVGFDAMVKIVHHEQMRGIPIVLETPYIGTFCPYRDEIEMLRTKIFKNLKPEEEITANTV